MTPEDGRFAARLYDGISSRSRDVRIIISPAGLWCDGRPLDRSAVRRIVEPIGRETWQFELADGGLIEADFADGAMLARALGQGRGRIGRWERSRLLILAAIPILLLVVWTIADDVVPFLADRVAQRLPASVDAAIGAKSVILFDHATSTSRISRSRRAVITAGFGGMVHDILGPNGAARLEFRDAPEIGPNAFTFPGGTVVVTDQLTAAVTDDEVLAVLAHELGHVEHRHVMRMILRSSGLAILAAAVIGDASTLGSVIVGFPVLVLQLDFSRAFETEADDEAFRWLSGPGRDPCDFARALLKIEAVAAHGTADSGRDGPPNWLSSHPGTPERIKRFEPFCRGTIKSI